MVGKGTGKFLFNGRIGVLVSSEEAGGCLKTKAEMQVNRRMGETGKGRKILC